MSTTVRQIDEDRLREAALSKLAAKEAIDEENQRIAEDQRKQAVRRQMDAQEDAAENATIMALAAEQSAYARRKELAEKIIPLLAEFAEVEQALRARVNALDYGIPPNTHALKAQQHIAKLRFAAGLAPSHQIIGLNGPTMTQGQKVARTALKAIVAAMIDSGFMRVGQASTRLEVEDSI